MNPDRSTLQRGVEAVRTRLSGPAGFAAFNRAMALISLAVGSGLVLACGWAVHRFHLDEFVFHRATAQGEVVENTPVRVGSQSGTRGFLGGTFYRAVVHFRLLDGRDLTVDDWVGMAPPSFRVGQSVTVIYDPEDPQHAMIDRGWKNYLAPGIPAVFGFLMILGGMQRLSGARAQRPPE